METILYKEIIKKAPFGYAYHKVVYDQNNKVTDYIFLEVNSLFEKQTGLKAENIINKKVTTIFPGFKDGEFDWIKFYGDVAVTGVEKDFEQFSEHINKWFKVRALSPKKGYFVTIFSDSSDKKIADNQLKALLQSSEVFIKQADSVPDYQLITNIIRELTGATYAAFNLFNEKKDFYTTMALSGQKTAWGKISQMVGFELYKKKWEVDQHSFIKNKNLKFYCFNSLSEITDKKISSAVIKEIESELNIKKTAFLKVCSENECLGYFILFFDEERNCEHIDIFEIFSSQVFLYLKRQSAQNIIQETKNSYQNLLENAGEGIIGIDLNGRHTFVNPKAQSILAYSEKEMLGKDSHSMWHHHHEDGTSYDEKDSPVIETLKSGKKFTKEGYFIQKSGKGVYVNYTGRPILIKGKIEGAVITFIDITKRKTAEEKVMLLASGLRSVSESVSITDTNNTIIFVNQSFLDIYQYSEEEIIGKNIELIRPDNDNKILTEKILSGTAQGGWKGEIYNRKKDGTKFPVFLSTSIINDDAGDVIAHIGVARDISELKEAENIINAQNKELQELIDTQNKFFSILSHDLRSPFSSFLGLTQLLRDNSEKMQTSEVHRIHTALYNSSKSTYKLLEDLLQWSRIQLNTITFEPEKILLQKFIIENLQTSYETASLKNIDILLNIPSDLSIYADANMLKVVLRNLLSNAIKFSHKEKQIRINAEENSNNEVKIEIEDEGIGMSEKIINHLFDISNSLSNRNGTSGEQSSGLGLILVNDFVKRHGDKITIHSTEEKGTRVSFNLKK